MLYCIKNLVTKHVEEPLECLCNLLKTVGKELEQVNLYFFIILSWLKIGDFYFKIFNEFFFSIIIKMSVQN